MKAYAICDTDIGRTEPKILLRYIYSTKTEAKQVQQWNRFDPEFYPIMEVSIKTVGVKG